MLRQLNEVPIWAVAILLVVTGCDQADVPTDESLPSFVATGAPTRCAGRCIQGTLYFAHAELGLDPTLSFDFSDDPHAILRDLRTRSDAAGGLIRILSVAELLNELDEGPMSPTVLAHQNGHLYLLLGTLDVDGQVLCQLAHGDMPVSLVPKTQLLQAGFQEAWQFENETGGVPVAVGSGSLRIDSICHNFGELRVDEEQECSFSLQNEGNTTLILGKPQTSCSCTTTAGAVENTQLRPGEAQNIEFTVRSTNTPAQRNTVLLTCFEQGSGESHQIQLFLIACQRNSMEVAPTRLDFGVVVPGESYTRTVRLSEVATDRFHVENCDVGELPVDYEIEETKGDGDFTVYRIRLRLVVDKESSGRQTGSFVVSTNSHVRPQVTIPVEFEMAPAIRLIPSVVSLGTVPVGEVVEETVLFVSRDGVPAVLEVDSQPECSSITIDHTKDPVEMLVAINLQDAGVWEDTIKVTATRPAGKEVFEIRCAGYGEVK